MKKRGRRKKSVILQKVGELIISDKFKLIVNITKVSGKIRLDVRVFVYSRQGEWFPTYKGINIPVEKTYELLKLLEKIEIIKK